MKNKILVALFALGLAFLGSKASAYTPSSVEDGWSVFTSTGSSISILSAGSGPFRVKRVWASSDTANVPTNWFQLLDISTFGIPGYFVGVGGLDPSKGKTPPLYFPIPSTSTLQGSSYNPIFDFGDDGVKFTSGCYIFKSANGSGGALQVSVEFRR